MIVIVMITAAVCITAAGLYLWMIRPCVCRQEKFEPFEKNYIAHRGLFDNAGGIPENTLPAFRRAVEAGFCIELDVQMTADKKLVVFHDWDMKRMAKADVKITEHTYEELAQYPLADSGESLPLFADVLRLIDGAVPLVVEIKVGFRYLETVRAAARMLEDYKGVYCIESFHPLALAWYRRHVPAVLRGLLSMDYRKDSVKMPWIIKFVLSNLMLNFCAQPDFISYNHKDQGKLAFRICRKIFKVKTAAWTVKSEQDLKSAGRRFDSFIFDSFLPHRGIRDENKHR